MNGETITLVIYGGVAFILALGGIYTLRKGFQLITSGRGKPAEKNTIKFLGLHVTTGSIGALVMVTSFLWAWAAKLALPQYQDGNITTSKLEKQLAVAHTKVNKLTDENKTQFMQLSSLKTNMQQYIVAAEANEKKLSDIVSFKTNEATNIVGNVGLENVLRDYNNQKNVLKEHKNKLKREYNLDINK